MDDVLLQLSDGLAASAAQSRSSDTGELTRSVRAARHGDPASYLPVRNAGERRPSFAGMRDFDDAPAHFTPAEKLYWTGPASLPFGPEEDPPEDMLAAFGIPGTRFTDPALSAIDRPDLESAVLPVPPVWFPMTEYGAVLFAKARPVARFATGVPRAFYAGSRAPAVPDRVVTMPIRRPHLPPAQVFYPPTNPYPHVGPGLETDEDTPVPFALGVAHDAEEAAALAGVPCVRGWMILGMPHGFFGGRAMVATIALGWIATDGPVPDWTRPSAETEAALERIRLRCAAGASAAPPQP